LNLLFSLVARYTATCFLLCILLQRGRINLSAKIHKRPFPFCGDNRRTWYCPSSLLLADYSWKSRSYQLSRRLLDVTTSTRDHVRRQQQLSVRRATSRRRILIRRMSVFHGTATTNAMQLRFGRFVVDVSTTSSSSSNRGGS